MKKCDHCLLEIKESEAIYDTIDDKEKIFCCQGCQGIYHLLHDEKLDTFYERRQGWQPGPSEVVTIPPELFNDAIRKHDSEKEIDISLSGIRCASCIWLIERFLKKSEGISYVMVNYATHKARIRWFDDKITLGEILQKILSIGYVPLPYEPSHFERVLKQERNDLIIRFGTASFFAMQLMLYSAALYAGYFQGIDPLYKKLFHYIAWLLSTPVMFYSGYPFIVSTFKGFKNRTFNMDTLVFLGSFNAYAYSVLMVMKGGEVYFDTSSMIITLILLGRLLESGAKGKAAGAIASLMKLQPKEARKVNTQGQTSEKEMVLLSSLKPGDVIEVIPGEHIPLDSVVIEGISEVDESMLTGEAMPVKKSHGAEVFGGTTNLNGQLLLKVIRVGQDTVLSHIIKTVEDTQARKAPIQTAADRIVGWFVPFVLILALVTTVVWYFLTGTVTGALMNGVSVLVIACPCALGLATPLAILVGSNITSSQGIMVKGGDILETLAKTNAIVFDKTGTLTSGEPALTHILSYNGTNTDVHHLASSIEQSSEHLIARAIKKGVKESELIPVQDFKVTPGSGVQGIIKGRKTIMGNMSFLTHSGVSISDTQKDEFIQLVSQGETTVGLAVNNELKGWLSVSDKVRPEAAQAVSLLKKMKFRVELLTGDHRESALRAGADAGIIQNNTDCINAEVSPVDKAARIRKLKDDSYKVVMVGDGINDAPSLIEADVGIAMGRATDIALKSADVVLMRNNLSLIPSLIHIARKTLSTIRQNLFWAFSYNIAAIPLAVSGLIHPIVSAAAMALSSLIVVGNSLRLRRYGTRFSG